MFSMSFNVDHSKHSRRKKTPETKETYAQGLYTFHVYSPLCFIYDTLFVVFAHYCSSLGLASSTTCCILTSFNVYHLQHKRSTNKEERSRAKLVLSKTTELYVSRLDSSLRQKAKAIIVAVKSIQLSAPLKGGGGGCLLAPATNT